MCDVREANKHIEGRSPRNDVRTFMSEEVLRNSSFWFLIIVIYSLEFRYRNLYAQHALRECPNIVLWLCEVAHDQNSIFIKNFVRHFA